ncbi:MAG: DUF4351 domain-containing protein [Aphanothece sp. CMT-3BRIN-NPC111]|nr:DUF4351 domain-containing protein [Aphanothece sp. CMT-3BRIN-NPC111]
MKRHTASAAIIAQLEDLGEALLDFYATTDLAAWLKVRKQ